MVRALLPLAVCCLLIIGCGPESLPPGEDSAEGLSDERSSSQEEPRVTGQTCAANPHSQLVVTDQAPVVREFASNGSSVVYLRGDGYVLADVSTGRRTGPLGDFITYSANERRAIFLSQSGTGPARLLDISPSTGSTSVIFEGQVDRAQPIAERRAVLVFTPGAPAWVYFTDTRRLRQLSPTPLNRDNVTLSRDETLAVFLSGTELRFLDVPTRGVGVIASSIVGFITNGHRNVLLQDSSGVLWDWTLERGRTHLGPGILPTASSTSIAGDRLWVEADGRVRLWRPAAGTLETVATGAERAELSRSGDRLFFVRGAGSLPRALVLRDLGSGQEQVVLETTREVKATLSDDGRLLAFGELPEDESEWSVRLWDFSRAGEVALTTAPPTTHYGVLFSFRQGGGLLQVFAFDREVLLYDTASGALIYRESRSVVLAEGEFSFWSPDESFFFMPVGGYLDRPADLFAFRPSRNRENFVASRAQLNCFVGQRPVIFHDIPETHPVAEGKLAAWDPWGRTLWELSPNSELPTCLSHKAAAVFFENVQPSSEPFKLGTRRLVYASLPKQRRTVLGSDVNAYVLHTHRLMYSDSRSICIVRF